MNQGIKQKILFVIPSLAGGGAERVITHLSNHISRDKYIPELLLIYDTEHILLNNLKKDIKITNLCIPTSKKYFFLQTLVAIMRQKPDIVFMGMSGINVLIAPFIPFLKRIKWIARETNTVSIHVQNKRMLFLYRNFYKNYNRIIAQCDDMKLDLVANFNIPDDKIRVINNPIDTEFINHQLSSKKSVLFPSGRINLLACGRLVPQKGFDLLLRAFAKINERKRFFVTIIGDTQNNGYKSELEGLIQSLGLNDLVNLAGYQSNVYHWYQQADIFVLSSRYEGFPNAVLEALCCGTPVLANRCKGGVDEIIKDGENGYLFDFSQENFEEKLKKVLLSDFDREQIRQDAKHRFDVSVIMAKYEEVIEAV
ncbi:glycosyltransferase [uncultured Draconibacterium sp.]|uniref:glycosyltransferase n=1 Tax=uncultured Draconibacterium sp. TaxID=1573823 RepID=UPI0029C6A545|nr:glycosyltransferase [uncultured Draconibacterium sp.]